jgi:nucleotide-binding universal stress UspA family protein
VLVTAAHISGLPREAGWARGAEPHLREACAAYLAGVRGRLGYPDCDVVVRDGVADEEIPLAAKEAGAAMIVAATHGRSGISRWMYGSTAGHLLHESTVPLLVVGKEALERHLEAPELRHVMVPLDGSSMAEAALPEAFELARLLRARVTLARAVPWAAQTYPFFTPGMYVPQLDEELVEGATAYLRQRQSEAPPGPPVETDLLRGPAAECLLAYEEGHDVDLVVMTTHAREGLGRAFLGSTADRMLHGRAPVLFIRPATVSGEPVRTDGAGRIIVA